MIELNGHVSQIFRSTERSPGFEARKGSQAKPAPSKGDASPSRSSSAFQPPASDSVINFEYVPSGRLNLNQEERQRLIDFFE